MLIHRYSQSYKEIVESVLPSDEAQEVCWIVILKEDFSSNPTTTLVESGHTQHSFLLGLGVCICSSLMPLKHSSCSLALATYLSSIKPKPCVVLGRICRFITRDL